MRRRYDFESPMFGIANADGGLWSHNTFFNEDEAAKFLREHYLNATCDLSKHTVVPVSVFINIKREKAMTNTPAVGE